MYLGDGVITPGIRTSRFVGQNCSLTYFTANYGTILSLIVTNINVSGNTVLNNLNVSGNTVLNNLNVSGNTILNNLDVSNNLVVYANTNLYNLDVSGILMLNSYETIDASGILSNNVTTSEIDSSGVALTISLDSPGQLGQIKIIYNNVNTTVPITLNSNLVGYTSAIFNNPGSSLTVWSNGIGWVVLAQNDVTLT
jgi:hypothetical protein